MPVTNSINPGTVWHDTNGQPIQAHGGGILYMDGTYYWYGEEKSEGYFNLVGVAGYRSHDLLNWESMGVVLQSKDFPIEFTEKGVCERPKVIFNNKTQKYIMWMHVDIEGYKKSKAGIAVADYPEGPFQYIGTISPIEGSTYRDMNLFVDDDEKAYAIFSGDDNETLYVVMLNDDYTAPAQPMDENKTWARIIPGQWREAPAMFKCDGIYYLITSGCTGWAPNEALIHTSSHILGPWKTLKNPCVGPNADKTFHSQSTYVLPVIGKPGCFIYMGDRWISDNLADSRYIWLPFTVKTNQDITLKWLDQWDFSIFDIL